MQAESLLEQIAGGPVEIVARELLAHGRGRVERITMAEPIDGVGANVIAKCRDFGADTHAAMTTLASEEVALRVIGCSGVDVAPRLLAGGVGDGILVMSDVGARSVESYVLGEDADAAAEALVELGRAAARLHAVPADPAMFEGIDTWTIVSSGDGWTVLRDAVAALGLPTISREVDEEHAAALHEWLTKEQSLAHGDLTPNNAVLAGDGRCRLIDFEGACVQHVGVDIVALRFPFAWYGRWAEMPRDVRDAMEGAYRQESSRTDDEIDDAVAVGCTMLTLHRLERLPRIADPDQPAASAFRRRAQIVSTIGVAIDAARAVDRFPAITGWFEGLLVAMRDRWPEAAERAPYYRAFAAR